MTTKWLVLAALLGVALLAAASPHPTVTVEVGRVTVRAESDVRVTVDSSTTALSQGTDGAAATSPLSTPAARYAVYALSGIAVTLLLQMIKARFALTGLRMVYTTLGVCAGTGAGITALFKDGSVSSLVSNPWNVVSALGIVFLGAYLAYQMFVKRRI